MYHRVDVASPADHTSRALTVSPSQFEAELRYLHAQGLRTIGIDELERDVAEGRRPERAVLITFDDGYGDQFRYAFPILQRFGDRAIFFVNTGNVGKAHHLTWREIDVMHRAGMSIECHGVDHVDLALLNAAAQQYQIDDCIRSLQGHLHDTVQAYAYPSGAFDAQTISIEERAGLSSWLHNRSRVSDATRFAVRADAVAGHQRYERCGICRAGFIVPSAPGGASVSLRWPL